jgi:hypothetical protein
VRAGSAARAQTQENVEPQLLVLDVLDDLKRDHRTKASVLEGRQVERVANLELEVGCAVVEPAVLDRALVDVQADHVRSGPGEDGGPKSSPLPRSRLLVLQTNVRTGCHHAGPIP